MLTLLAAAAGAGGAAILRQRAWVNVEMEDLLGRAGGPTSTAEALNDDGRIVGSASGRAFRHDGRSFAWLTPLHIGSEAAAIDAAGTAVGSYWSTDLGRRPGYWQLGGSTRELVVPLGHGGRATGMEAGLVAGTVWARGGTPRDRAWLWSADAIAEAGEALPSLPDSRSFAHDIGAGGIVGGTVISAAGQHGCIWDLSSPQRTLQILPDTGGQAASVEAVSNLGLAVGWSRGPTGPRTACSWDLSTNTVRCVPLEGLDDGPSCAHGVNSAGTIVGWSTSADHKRRACAWLAGEPTPVDLGTLGGDTSAALGVNNLGVVVGSASTGAGAVGLPLRPGGWSWEDRAFRHRLKGSPAS